MIQVECYSDKLYALYPQPTTKWITPVRHLSARGRITGRVKLIIFAVKCKRKKMLLIAQRSIARDC